MSGEVLGYENSVVFYDVIECLKKNIKIKPIKRYRRLKVYFVYFNKTNYKYALISSNILKKKCINQLFTLEDLKNNPNLLNRLLEYERFVIVIRNKTIDISEILEYIKSLVLKDKEE